MQRCEDNVAARLNGNALQPLSDVFVTVTDDHTGLPAALYSDNGVTQVFQPLKTDDNGYYGFYAANGEYTLTFSGIRIATFTRKVVLNDFDDNPAVTKAELAAGSGSTLVTFTQAGADAKARDLQDRGREVVSVFDFMTPEQIADARANTLTLDCSAAIQKAFGSAVFSKRRVTIPQGCSLRITAPIVIPCAASFVGAGGNSKIVADYSAWTGTDYRAVIVKSREGINYAGNEYGQIIGDFSLFGINNSSLVSTGMDFSAAATIAPASSVNYALYGAIVRNVLVSGFDTAYNIKECWNTTFDGIYSMYCRAGVMIHGKSVNLTFSKVRLANFANTNTSSTAATQGVDIRSGFHYSAGAEGRPEGIVFTPGCLIFGADTNLYVSQCLYFRITDSIIDGATNYGVRIGTADGVKIEGNYIYASAANSMGVALDAIATSDSKVEITCNHFVGSGAAGQFGVNAGLGLRYGVSITENFFRGLISPIFLNNCAASKVQNNYGRGNAGPLVRVQTGCENTIIDGNTSDDAYPILTCQPSTSPDVEIHRNYSPVTKTHARGKVTLLAGTTSIAIPSGLHSGAENYLRAYTTVKPSANVGAFWVTDAVSTSSTATFNCAVAPGANVVIYYEAQAIPSSAL